eukprot:TRINITY_DN2935_c0_g1_i3.p1 TRINITY_DN2935_c0_g1~~TRINITY_DN2935_c0_g1_i3.p1  ORF type:complete len:1070 (-),score=184.58 TRINITY_DN2935_c0_g1_i3:346-3555(-)
MSIKVAPFSFSPSDDDGTSLDASDNIESSVGYATAVRKGALMVMKTKKILKVQVTSKEAENESVRMVNEDDNMFSEKGSTQENATHKNSMDLWREVFEKSKSETPEQILRQQLDMKWIRFLDEKQESAYWKWSAKAYQGAILKLFLITFIISCAAVGTVLIIRFDYSNAVGFPYFFTCPILYTWVKKNGLSFKSYKRIVILIGFIYCAPVIYARYGDEIQEYISTAVTFIVIFGSIFRLPARITGCIQGYYLVGLAIVSTLYMYILQVLSTMLPVLYIIMMQAVLYKSLELASRSLFVNIQETQRAADDMQQEQDRFKSMLPKIYPHDIVRQLSDTDKRAVPVCCSDVCPVICIHVGRQANPETGYFRTRELTELIGEIQKSVEDVNSKFHRFQKIKNLANMILLSDAIYDTEASTDIGQVIEYAQCLQQMIGSLSQAVISKRSVVICVASGCVEAGIVSCENRSFDMIGEGVIACQQLIADHRHTQGCIVVVDSTIKEMAEGRLPVSFQQDGAGCAGWTLSDDKGPKDGFRIRGEEMTANTDRSLQDNGSESDARVEKRHVVFGSKASGFHTTRQLITAADIQEGVDETEMDEIDDEIKTEAGAASPRSSDGQASSLTSQRRLIDKHQLGSAHLWITISGSLLWGVLESVILERTGNSGFDRGGVYVFVRLCVILPLSMIVVSMQSMDDVSKYGSRAVERQEGITYFVLSLHGVFYFAKGLMCGMIVMESSEPDDAPFQVMFFINELHLWLAIFSSNPVVSLRTLALGSGICSVLLGFALYSIKYQIISGYASPLSRAIDAISNIAMVNMFSFLQVYIRVSTENQEKDFQTTFAQKWKLLTTQKQLTWSYITSAVPQSLSDILTTTDAVPIRRLGRHVFICIQVCLPDHLPAPRQPGDHIRFISELFSVIDKACKHTSIRPAKTFGHFYVAQYGVEKDDEVVRAVDFGLMVYQMICARVSGNMDGVLRMGIGCGEAFGGVMEHSRLSYDYWGAGIEQSIELCRTCEDGHAQIGAEAIGFVSPKYGYRIVQEQCLGKRGQDGTRHLVDLKANIWGDFLRVVDWIDETTL